MRGADGAERRPRRRSRRPRLPRRSRRAATVRRRRRAIRTRRATSRRRSLPDGAGSAGRCVRQLHHRADVHTGARDDGAARGAAGHGSQLHDESADSKIYPGIAREQGTFGTPDPNNPAKLDVTTSRAGAVHAPRGRVHPASSTCPARCVPFIVGADGPDPLLFTALDNLIAQKRVPVMVAISISNGSGDAQGSQRGLEYDTMSGRLRGVRRDRSAAARREAVQREAHEGSRRARDDGMQFGRRGGAWRWRGIAPICTIAC